METDQFVIMISIAGVLVLGSTLQSAAGFGFGLFTIPLLIMLGCRSYEAIVMVSVAVGAHTLVGVIVLRRHVRWKRVLVMIALACVAQPAGVAVLGVLAEQDRDTVRRVFGAIVLLAVLLQVGLRVKPRERLHPIFMVAAMPASGFMGGLSGMGGPPAVLWVMAHRWSNPESRATLWAFFGGTTPVQLALLWREFGSRRGRARPGVHTGDPGRPAAGPLDRPPHFQAAAANDQHDHPRGNRAVRPVEPLTAGAMRHPRNARGPSVMLPA
jgi:uncharacterized membrane protein YfcA